MVCDKNTVIPWYLVPAWFRFFSSWNPLDLRPGTIRLGASGASTAGAGNLAGYLALGQLHLGLATRNGDVMLILRVILMRYWFSSISGPGSLVFGDTGDVLRGYFTRGYNGITLA